ncbi:MAG: UrcA family protein [Gammaproteobacteria bacterium]|nr:UrcA family protein [Gammaproteobacteria bacterium]
MNVKRNLFGLFAAVGITTALAAGFSTNAGAAPADATAARPVVVRYGHLDLARDGDRRVLYRMLRNAAGRACGNVDIRDLTGRAAWVECRKEALDDAVTRIGNDRLTELHRGNGAESSAGPRLAADR